MIYEFFDTCSSKSGNFASKWFDNFFVILRQVEGKRLHSTWDLKSMEKTTFSSAFQDIVAKLRRENVFSSFQLFCLNEYFSRKILKQKWQNLRSLIQINSQTIQVRKNCQIKPAKISWGFFEFLAETTDSDSASHHSFHRDEKGE